MTMLYENQTRNEKNECKRISKKMRERKEEKVPSAT